MGEMKFTKALHSIILKGKETRDFITKDGKRLKFDEINVVKVYKDDIKVILLNKGKEIVEFGPFPLINAKDTIKITKLSIRMGFFLN